MLQITRPYLPPRQSFSSHVDGIYSRQWLTNDGPLVKQLEVEVAQFLGSPEMALVSNGTMAIQLAIQALDLRGEIITTPFSYIATTTSILWENCSPTFVDIERDGFNIDASSIEEAITDHTSAILATHCFGIACDIEKIQNIADRHGLKVIYDAAHCFGSTYDGESIFRFGDIATCSFHATKLFHTVEGGGVFANDPDVLHKIRLLRNFGHDGPEKFTGLGINGKNSEFHAAMGLAILPHIDDILMKRHEINERYFMNLSSQVGVSISDPKREGWNSAYCPVFFESENSCLAVKKNLEKENIFPRRYFYPSLDTIHPQDRVECTRARSMASRILCLPSFHELKDSEIDRICTIISNTLDS